MMSCPSTGLSKPLPELTSFEQLEGAAFCPAFPMDFAVARACRQEFQFANNKFEQPVAP